jgi:hypothetical protein
VRRAQESSRFSLVFAAVVALTVAPIPAAFAVFAAFAFMRMQRFRL